MLNGQKSILVVSGPNLNLLGIREPHIYGHETLKDVESAGKAQAETAGAVVDFLQTNHEGVAIDRIQAARTDGTDGIVLNPGGWTQSSVSIRDALLGVDIPFVEVHVANIHAREEWRHHSYFQDKAAAIINGCGVKGYQYAIDLILTNEKKFPRKADATH